MDWFITSEIMDIVGQGIMLSGLFIFLAFTFFVYLNGREMKEYYLILFGMLGIKDVVFALVFIIVCTIGYTISNIDKIILNAEDKFYRKEKVKEKVIRKPLIEIKITNESKVKIDENTINKSIWDR